jgi:hypothetical protein
VHQGAVVMFRLLVQELLNNSFVEGWSTKNSSKFLPTRLVKGGFTTLSNYDSMCMISRGKTVGSCEPTQGSGFQ